ncbi:hypothetical protein [Paenibacillus sp. NPDC057967]|uniref:hypothetical protein n=1 Tax=Paenibacillus sp. NPDC057967 TaxID=3346293 RepID=UPI0036DAC5AB
MKCFHQTTEYPEDSGWSYTRYYYPESFEQGRRLEHSAKDILGIFKDIRKEHGLSKNLEIPMEYFIFSIEYALKVFGASGKNVDWPTPNQWKEAITHSGYIESEIFMALA